MLACAPGTSSSRPGTPRHVQQEVVVPDLRIGDGAGGSVMAPADSLAVRSRTARLSAGRLRVPPYRAYVGFRARNLCGLSVRTARGRRDAREGTMRGVRSMLGGGRAAARAGSSLIGSVLVAAVLWTPVGAGAPPARAVAI